MGTYRTNHLHANTVLKIVDFKITRSLEHEEKLDIEIITEKTKYRQFHSPCHTDYIWELGENRSHVADGRKLNKAKFENRPLYKVVSRDSESYILFLNLTEKSEVYDGASSGSGLYFETCLLSALSYINTESVSHNWTDTDCVDNID